MKTINDYLKTKLDKESVTTTRKPLFVNCSCGSHFSSKLLRCPKCGLVYESPEVEKNWKGI